MHFRFHDIDAAGPTVRLEALAPAVGHRAGCRDDGIEDAFEDLVAVRVEHRIGRHQVADVAHEHEAAPGQGEFFTLRRRVDAILFEGTRHHLATFFEGRFEIGLHQAEPVPVCADLVFGVDRRDRVLTVLDRRDRRLEDDVGEIGGRVLTDRVFGVDQQLDVQPVIAEQERRARALVTPARIPGRVNEPGRPAGSQRRDEHVTVIATMEAVGIDVRMTHAVEWQGLVEESCRFTDHGSTACRVVAAGSLLPVILRDRVGAVERVRVVQAAPAGVCRIDRKARVGNRHDELRSGNLGDLGIDIGRLDFEGVAVGHEVADLAQEIDVRIMVKRLVASCCVPRIDLLLHLVAFVEQRPVDGRQFPDDGLESCPEHGRPHADRRQQFVFDELRKYGGNRQPAQDLVLFNVHRFVHGEPRQGRGRYCSSPPARYTRGSIYKISQKKFDSVNFTPGVIA